MEEVNLELMLHGLPCYHQADLDSNPSFATGLTGYSKQVS